MYSRNIPTIIRREYNYISSLLYVDYHHFIPSFMNLLSLDGSVTIILMFRALLFYLVFYVVVCSALTNFQYI
ncbi:unnamed protein product [Brugia pahangi]|uniref:Ovule protein n=1 Tax=Brugia pahangi TaxID=6280 RepID=A0A0N4SXI8_BRUPA|nr:unnamed protein product [Brugia pahangi]